MKAGMVICAVAALSLATTGAADAKSKHKRNKVRSTGPVAYHGYAPSPYPAYTRTPGPIWAGPGECYTDEGYGRYAACGAGRGGK